MQPEYCFGRFGTEGRIVAESTRPGNSAQRLAGQVELLRERKTC